MFPLEAALLTVRAVAPEHKSFEGGGVIEKVKVPAALVPKAFVAVIVTEKEPPTVGVPLIKPVDVLSVKPEGNALLAKLVGQLLAMILYEKAVPTIPVTEAVETTGGDTEL